MALFLTVVLALSSTVFGANVNITQDKDTMALGKLYFVNVEEDKQPVMTGLTLFGNRCGTEAFNHKPYATEGIRSVFELDEWIEFYPETKAVTGIQVMVFQHKADQGFYLTPRAIFKNVT